MLQTLRVKNLAIVENITVEFGDRLNVITGETGAGKSVIIGALGLILGERADKNMIRAGEDKCGVEAVFQLPDPASINAVLNELEITPADDGCLIIRRIVSTSGSGKILVNDTPATVQALAAIGNLLVDMHGPHDHQSLLNRDFQLEVLDSFGKLHDTRRAYEQIYLSMLHLENRLKELQCDDQQVEQQIDMLKFQIREIEDANLAGTDEAELENEHAVAGNAQQILQLCDIVRNAVADDDSSAFNSMVTAQTALQELARILPEAADWQNEARSIAVSIQELLRSVTERAESVEADPARLQWLDDRLSLIRKLKRRYGATVREIMAFLDTSRQRLHDLETRSEQIAAISSELKAVCAKLNSTGRKLSGQRTETGSVLAKAITKELHGLGFPHGSFEIALHSVEPCPTGLDEIEFGFAPNVGEPMRAMRAIASSGEISRVMLAVKSVLAVHDRIPVLVFDEIDANVGGEMGAAVGARLADVSRSHQVLCITHLPQVAVTGKTHLVVTKEVVGGRTRTHIRPVTDNDRVEEVARMLGGRDLTSVTLKHAKEMLAPKTRH